MQERTVKYIDTVKNLCRQKFLKLIDMGGMAALGTLRTIGADYNKLVNHIEKIGEIKDGCGKEMHQQHRYIRNIDDIDKKEWHRPSHRLSRFSAFMMW